MKKSISTLFAACWFVFASSPAWSIPVTLADFGAGAKTIHTSSFGLGATTLISGGVTITGGVNFPGEWLPANAELSYLDWPNSGGPITVHFAAPVSQMGAGFVSINVPVTLSIFSVTNDLLESYTLGPAGLGTLYDPISNTNYSTGFIGLSAGGALIDHATFTTTEPYWSLYIGPVVYISEPAGALLFLSGLAAIGALRRRYLNP
jgi:hypothetical protein